MKHTTALGITGFSLIAVTYGMARFSWGLMMPEVVKEVPFSPQIAGIIAACSYLAYCLAIVCAPFLVSRFGPRMPALTAALAAALGLILLALAHSPFMLAVGLFIAGTSAGLSSPALAEAVSQRISAPHQPQVNTVINAGTGAGIIISVPIVMAMPGGWRMACVSFAALAALCLAMAYRHLPDRPHAKSAHLPFSLCELLSPALLRLSIIALISGAASAAWWSFGPDILSHHLTVKAQLRSLLWLISGAAGILAIFTGLLARYLTWTHIYRLSQICMALPLLLMAFLQSYSGWLIPAVAMCGAGYVTLSGVLLVYAAESVREAPAAGVSVAFFMLAAGQVVGSALFGQIYAQYSVVVALIVFAGMSGGMLFTVPRKQCEEFRPLKKNQ
ncbi:MFS transporter [Pseudocitrobacter faecalis]|uniref:MFS transporter n=1 Tax=Pseudocitrobacter faecalis TaxID=1398493 RepID=UPI003BA2D1F2